MNCGPARARSSAPASRPIFSALSAIPVNSTSYHSVPSGVMMSPRKRNTPSSISARPAIGVLHEPSSDARKLRSQAIAVAEAASLGIVGVALVGVSALFAAKPAARRDGVAARA